MNRFPFRTFAAAASLAWLATAGISPAAEPNRATTARPPHDRGGCNNATSASTPREEGQCRSDLRRRFDHGELGNRPGLWNKYYASGTPSPGVAADETCHVLWRLDHGNIDGIRRSWPW